ncbi:MAG: long-chain fatty acid--CoA ligase, partial [Halomonas sp.]|nr:long-chain fatty acid--CoA ligase [Halomonas sp.]
MPGSPEALLAQLARHATDDPERPALDDGHRRVTFAELPAEVEARRQRLDAAGAERVALALDNGIDWALWDLA